MELLHKEISKDGPQKCKVPPRTLEHTSHSDDHKQVDLSTLNRYSLAHFIVMGIDDKDKDPRDLTDKYMGDDALSVSEYFASSSESEDEIEEKDEGVRFSSPRLSRSKVKVPRMSSSPLVTQKQQTQRDQKCILSLSSKTQYGLALFLVNIAILAFRYCPIESWYRNAVLVTNTVILTLITLYGSTRTLYISFQDDVERKNGKSNDSSRVSSYGHKNTAAPSPTKRSDREPRNKKRKPFKLTRCPSMSVVEGLDNKSRPISLNKSGWSLCREDFKVRGPHYASDRKKINSLSSMFEVAAVDLFKCKRKVDNISSFVTLPLPRDEKARDALSQTRLDEKRTPWYDSVRAVFNSLQFTSLEHKRNTGTRLQTTYRSTLSSTFNFRITIRR